MKMKYQVKNSGSKCFNLFFIVLSLYLLVIEVTSTRPKEVMN
jgi:hypothetical protein